MVNPADRGPGQTRSRRDGGSVRRRNARARLARAAGLLPFAAAGGSIWWWAGAS